MAGLVARLEYEHGDVRGAAADGLCKLVPLGPATVKRLEAPMSHGKRDVRYHAARVLVADEEARGLSKT